MSKISDAEQVKSQLADLPDQFAGLRLLVLFGSLARGRATPASDADLGVLCEGAFDVDALYLAIAPLLRIHHVDLVDLRRAPPLLAFEIARSGSLIFERTPGIFREFQSLAYRRYCDSAHLRDATKKRIRFFLDKEGLL
jgi:uncharacterized protein